MSSERPAGSPLRASGARTSRSAATASRPPAPLLARTLALAAAQAIRADLVGVDLLPTGNGYVIAELNGAVDVQPWYRYDGDVYGDAVFELMRTAADRRALAVPA